MDTIVFDRLVARKHRESRPFCGLCGLFSLAAALLLAGVGMSCAAHGQSPSQPARAAASSPAALAPPTQPTRFDPAFENSGHEVFDERDLSPAVEPGRAGMPWPTLGGKRGMRGTTEESTSDLDGEAHASGVQADTNPVTNAHGWFSDDAISLTGWLFGHEGASASVNTNIPSVSHAIERCDCPTWVGQIDALMLWMGNIPSQPLYIDSTSGATAIDANQLVPALSAAPRYSVIYNRDQCRSIEVNYFSIWGFDARRSVGPVLDDQGNGALTLNVAGLDLANIVSAQAETSASIQSFEVNLRKVEWEWVRWITGFRWVEFGQSLTLTDVAFVPDAPLVGDQLAVDTFNNLYGWQWGADAMFWNNGGRVRVNGIAKAGVYYNHQALQNTQYVQFDETGITSSTSSAADKDSVSFFGEAGITGSVAITNWLSWRAGYTLFWIEGIATPANQLASTSANPAGPFPSASVSPYGGVFLHGVNTGLEARW